MCRVTKHVTGKSKANGCAELQSTLLEGVRSMDVQSYKARYWKE